MQPLQRVEATAVVAGSGYERFRRGERGGGAARLRTTFSSTLGVSSGDAGKEQSAMIYEVLFIYLFFCMYSSCALHVSIFLCVSIFRPCVVSAL